MGLYVPEIDEDVYVPSLCRRIWGLRIGVGEMDRRRSPAKVALSSENGRREGRLHRISIQAAVNAKAAPILHTAISRRS